MAKKDNRKRGQKDEAPRWSNELTGIVLICLGSLGFLSVISFTPSDLPVWSIGKTFATGPEATVPRENFIGQIGVLVGLAHVALVGRAAFLIPVAMIWFGIVKLVFQGRLFPRTTLGFAILALSASAFLHAGWSEPGELPGEGGVVGRILASQVLLPLIGKAGTMIVCGLLYLVALVLLTGQRPLRFMKGCFALMASGVARIKTYLAERKSDAEKQERMNREREREKERRRKEREAAKAAKAGEARAQEPQAELPLRETPKPQIIDASQRRVAAPKPGEKLFERKKQDGHTMLSTDGFEDYELPGFELLDEVEVDSDAPEANREELISTQKNIVDTLRSFGIETTPGDITRGPTITRYEIYPSVGLRVSRISQLEADLARATRAERINILAPIPGKDTVGIELANSEKVAVPLHELLQDPEFRSAKKKIPLALGKDVYGKTVIGDLAAMPHLLVAGATGSGKSVCINSIIASMLFKFGPDELRFIMVDPKVVEMQMYNKLPHLVVPVVTDPKKTVAALKWVVNEMEKRYRVFAKFGVRNFDGFNKRELPEKEEPAVEESPEEEEEVDQEHIEEVAAAL
ncbi:MAG: DNA translocase FtsK 4TM domain-containing protein, partial [Verrucomicrobiales bacterium]